MNTEPDSLMFKCGIEPVECSLRRSHLETDEEIARADITNPFYEIEMEKLKQDKVKNNN